MLLRLFLSFGLLLSGARVLWAATPLVDADWVLAHLDDPALVIVDLQSREGYLRAHLPGARHSDYGQWRTRSGAGQTPKLLPPVAELERLIGALGIDNDSHVLLSPFGQSASDMATAARVYWTFKALGHDRISILDGGLLGYARGGRDRPLQRGPVEAEGKTFKASVRGDYLVGKEQVQAALAKGEVLVDNRSRAEYLGVYRAGGKERPGTIGGSLNLPYDWLTVNGGGKLHALDDLKAIYQAVGVPLQGEQISFCHTGHRTALAWFVSHELLGNRQARLYDGSMAEWAADSSLPIASQVELQCASC